MRAVALWTTRSRPRTTQRSHHGHGKRPHPGRQRGPRQSWRCRPGKLDKEWDEVFDALFGPIAHDLGGDEDTVDALEKFCALLHCSADCRPIDGRRCCPRRATDRARARGWPTRDGLLMSRPGYGDRSPPGSTSWPATSASRPTAFAAASPSSASGSSANNRTASVTRPSPARPARPRRSR